MSNTAVQETESAPDDADAQEEAPKELPPVIQLVYDLLAS